MQVHLCTHRKTGVVYAVKKLETSGLNSKQMRSELATLKAVRAHPHIIKLVEVFPTERAASMVRARRPGSGTELSIYGSRLAYALALACMHRFHRARPPRRGMPRHGDRRGSKVESSRKVERCGERRSSGYLEVQLLTLRSVRSTTLGLTSAGIGIVSRALHAALCRSLWGWPCCPVLLRAQWEAAARVPASANVVDRVAFHTTGARHRRRPGCKAREYRPAARGDRTRVHAAGG